MSASATSAKVVRSDELRSLLDELGDWSRGRGPLFRQLARGIAGGIERGALAGGRRLPGERELARVVHLSRGTVVAAYDTLVAEGMVDRRKGSGTFVAGAEGPGWPAGREGSSLVHRLVDRSGSSSPIIDLSLSVIHDAGDLPAVGLSTADFVGLAPDSGYSPWGLPELRAAVAEQVTGWGLASRAQEVVITTGAQQAISAAAACWVRPGDRVAVEDPTYPGAISAFTQAGARLVGVATDHRGVRPAALAEVVATRPALVYLQSAVHSPTGAILSDERRQRVAAILGPSGVPLVEDLALADLAWSTVPPPIASYDKRVIAAVVGSLSKLFWGGLRVGWLRAPEAVALRIARVKATHDLGSSAPSQLLAQRLLATATKDGFAARRRAELRRRHDTLTSTLASELPDWRWRQPMGGLSIWVRIPGGEAERFARHALLHGVDVAPAGRALSCTDAHADRLRLSFSPPAPVLREGVRRLATAWAAWCGPGTRSHGRAPER